MYGNPLYDVIVGNVVGVVDNEIEMQVHNAESETELEAVMTRS